MAALATFPLAVVVGAVDRMTGPLGRMQGSLSSFGKRISSVGRGLTLGITAPVLGFGAAALNAGIDFETGMLNVQALTGETAEALKPLSQQARDLGRDTQFTARQATEGMGELALAGLKVNEIYSATPRVLDLAAASQLGMGEAAESAIGVLKGQGFQMEELGRVVDGLTQGFTKSPQSIGLLVEALKETGPALAGTQTGFEDQLAILSTLAAGMKRGAEAGTAVRNMSLNLIRPTTTARASIKKLGIELSQLQVAGGGARNLVEVFDLLAAKGAGPGELFDIFGKKAFTAAKILAANVPLMREFAVVMNDSVGRTAAIAAIRLQGTAGELLKFKSAMGELGIAVSKAGLQKMFTGLVKDLTAWVKGLTLADKAQIKSAIKWAAIAAAVGPVALILGQVTLGVGAAAKGFGLLFKVLKPVTLFMVKKLVPAILRTSLALIVSPFGPWILAAGVVVAAGVLIVKNWEKIKATAISIWNAIAGAISDAVKWIGSSFEFLADLIIPEWLERLLGIDLGSTTVVASGPPGDPDLSGVAGPGIGGPGGAGGEANVRIAFDNLPDGTTVTTDGGADLDMGLGFAMVTA